MQRQQKQQLRAHDLKLPYKFQKNLKFPTANGAQIILYAKMGLPKQIVNALLI